MKYTTSLFIRNLRLENNQGLHAAYCTVIPCFFKQLSDANPYRGFPTIQFIIESLLSVHEVLKNKSIHHWNKQPTSLPGYPPPNHRQKAKPLLKQVQS